MLKEGPTLLSRLGSYGQEKRQDYLSGFFRKHQDKIVEEFARMKAGPGF